MYPVVYAARGVPYDHLLLIWSVDALRSERRLKSVKTAVRTVEIVIPVDFVDVRPLEPAANITRVYE